MQRDSSACTPIQCFTRDFRAARSRIIESLPGLFHRLVEAHPAVGVVARIEQHNRARDVRRSSLGPSVRLHVIGDPGPRLKLYPDFHLCPSDELAVPHGMQSGASEVLIGTRAGEL